MTLRKNVRRRWSFSDAEEEEDKKSSAPSSITSGGVRLKLTEEDRRAATLSSARCFNELRDPSRTAGPVASRGAWWATRPAPATLFFSRGCGTKVAGPMLTRRLSA